MYNPNFAQDTYAGNVIMTELEVTKYVSDLVGWNYMKTYGTFTFGGKGTNLYATKVAINKADKQAASKGCLRNKYFMITSKNGHPCHLEVCNWLGIGSDNCYEITIKDIANDVGISEATLYRMFNKKENIVIKVAIKLQTNLFQEYFLYHVLYS